MRVSADLFICLANSKRIGVFNDRALEVTTGPATGAGNMAEMNMTHLPVARKRRSDRSGS